MNLDKLPHWLQVAIGATGGFGIFLVAFLDSSVVPLPVLNDLMVINYSILSPARMPYYALMATLGSLVGCTVLYFIARKGGEALFHKHAGPRAVHVRVWLERNGFMTLLVGGLLPPPAPFKVVVIGAGVFQVPFRAFLLAILVARGIRFYGEGFLAVRYGDRAHQFLVAHKVEFALITLGAVLLIYLLTKLLLRVLHRAA
jgi:membrane protein YqaA with SNARE-associated domain